MIRFYVLRWVQAWVQVTSGLVAILTLGMYWPRWEFDFVFWFARYKIKNNIRK